MGCATAKTDMNLLQLLGVTGKAGVGSRYAPRGAVIFGMHGFEKGRKEAH